MFKLYKPIIGIIGGMGPLATVDMMNKLISLSGGISDQDCVPMIVDCNTQIPDRTLAIISGHDDPLHYLIRSAVHLESLNASVLLIACNTAHYYYDQIQKCVSIPIIHMLKQTVKEVKRQKYKNVGLLATAGTLKSNIYQKLFDEEKINYILPYETEESIVMDLIYKGIKSNNSLFDIGLFIDLLEKMQHRGAEIFILGCTELPIAFSLYKINIPFLDPTLIAARSALESINYVY